MEEFASRGGAERLPVRSAGIEVQRQAHVVPAPDLGLGHPGKLVVQQEQLPCGRGESEKSTSMGAVRRLSVSMPIAFSFARASSRIRLVSSAARKSRSSPRGTHTVNLPAGDRIGEKPAMPHTVAVKSLGMISASRRRSSLEAAPEPGGAVAGSGAELSSGSPATFQTPVTLDSDGATCTAGVEIVNSASELNARRNPHLQTRARNRTAARAHRSRTDALPDGRPARHPNLGLRSVAPGNDLNRVPAPRQVPR